MSTNQIIKTFLIRFFAFFAILSGALALGFEFGPVVATEVSYRLNKLNKVSFKVAQDPSIENVTLDEQNTQDSSGGFGSLGKSQEKIIQPVSTEFGIVIEKINANAKIIPDVDPAKEKEYAKALAEGVAAAKGSTLPGEPGNLYIFSHSTDAPWNIVRFNAIFYLLRELEKGDKIIIFYQGRRYDYIVFDKAVTKSSDITYLTNRYDKPVLTLQTCDPPGTLVNRLIVVAKLLGS